MTMVFERVQTQGIAQLSYLIGDDSSGTAAVIDPRPNVDLYLALARQIGSPGNWSTPDSPNSLAISPAA